MHDAHARVTTRTDRTEGRQYTRPTVRPYVVNVRTQRIEWMPLAEGGRKRSRLPRAV